MICEFPNHFGYFLSFQEHSLRNTAVLNFGLRDEDGLVGQVVVNFDFPNAVVLQSAFDDMLLEVSIEAQHFAIVFDPGRLHSGNRLVFRLLPFFLEAEAG